MEKKGLAIMLTNRCNAECAICGVSCSPKLDGVIDEALMIDVINQAKDIGTFQQIGFTGGEAFLYTDLLIKGLNHAKKLGFTTSVATNGFWGSWSDEKIDAVLSAAKPDAVFLSFDMFHGEYIKPDSIEGAVRACRRNNINHMEIAIGEAEGKFSAENTFELLGDFKFAMKYKIYPFLRVGRAANLPKSDFYLMNQPVKRCFDEKILTVRFDGAVFPCCSSAVFNSCLQIGNIKNNSLADLMNHGKFIDVYNLIHDSKSFAELTEIARQKNILTDEDKNLSSCEICQLMFKDEENYKILSADIEKLYNKFVFNNLFNRKKSA